MPLRPSAHSFEWYYNKLNSPEDEDDIAFGFGLDDTSSLDLLSQFYTEADLIPDQNERYWDQLDTRTKLQQIEKMYEKFEDHLADVPYAWRTAALQRLLQIAYIKKIERSEVRQQNKITPILEAADSRKPKVTNGSSITDETVGKESSISTPPSENRRSLTMPPSSTGRPKSSNDMSARSSSTTTSEESLAPDTMVLSREVDPFNTPLKLNVHFIDPRQNIDEQFGIFSTKFWSRPDESPVSVSFELLERSLVSLLEHESLDMNIYLDQWSGSKFPIREENMLNTAIYEILELGATTATLTVKAD